jgi:small subunit ribosomal protein S3
MGHKTHPIGFRLGIIKQWSAKWYGTDKAYKGLVKEDLTIRSAIRARLRDAAISRIEIERSTNQVTVTIHTAKPGVVIGKGGQKVEELRQRLGKATGKVVKVNIFEIRYPEVDANLIAESIAQQLERRVSFRKALKQSVQRAMKSGTKGVRVMVAGRLGGSEMSRREWEREGRVPLHTLRADIEFGRAIAKTTYGTIGVKAWVYRGDVAPTPRAVATAGAQQRPAIAPPPPAAAPAPAGTVS